MNAPLQDPAHPLSTQRRTGVVTDISGAPTSVLVAIGGDTSEPAACYYLDSYTPRVDDVVVLLSVSGDHIIIGAISGTSNPILKAYTPTLKSIGGTDPTNWTTSGYYTIWGNWCAFDAQFMATSGTFTTGSGAYAFQLPRAAVFYPGAVWGPVGTATVSTTAYNFIAVVPNDGDADQCCIYRPGVTPVVREGASGPYGNAWTNSEKVHITGMYRI